MSEHRVNNQAKESMSSLSGIVPAKLNKAGDGPWVEDCFPSFCDACHSYIWVVTQIVKAKGTKGASECPRKVK